MTQDKIPTEITPEQSTDTLDDYLIIQKPSDVIDLAEQEQRYAERQFFASLAERTELDAAFNRGLAIGLISVFEEDFKMGKEKAKAKALKIMVERGISLADAKEILAAL